MTNNRPTAILLPKFKRIMEQYISKSALVAEIERKINEINLDTIEDWRNRIQREHDIEVMKNILSLLDTLEVIDPYEQCVQYDSIKAGIQAHAETYSFNIESMLFPQLTKEQQKLWRKEIEQACISGGNAGYSLARDRRYKENLEVDLEKEFDDYIEKQNAFTNNDNSEIKYYNGDSFNHDYDIYPIAKHFYELGLKSKGE